MGLRVRIAHSTARYGLPVCVAGAMQAHPSRIIIKNRYTTFEVDFQAPSTPCIKQRCATRATCWTHTPSYSYVDTSRSQRNQWRWAWKRCTCACRLQVPLLQHHS